LKSISLKAHRFGAEKPAQAKACATAYRDARSSSVPPLRALRSELDQRWYSASSKVETVRAFSPRRLPGSVFIVSFGEVSGNVNLTIINGVVSLWTFQYETEYTCPGRQ